MSICQLVKGAHNIGEYNAHPVLMPAYRRPIFADDLVRELTLGYLLRGAQRLGVHIAAIEFGPDHVHLFVENWRCYAPAELAQRLKGYSSHMMRRGHAALFEHPLWETNSGPQDTSSAPSAQPPATTTSTISTKAKTNTGKTSNSEHRSATHATPRALARGSSLVIRS